MNKPLTAALAALALSSLGTGQAPARQASSAKTKTEAPVVGLHEVIVTAERVREDSQRTPVALNTITGAAIRDSNAIRPGALTSLVPALQVSNDTGPYSIFYIRGVGNFAANGLSDPAVQFNFDGVPVSRSGTSGFFYDIERVEVLKGPQGTLYGRNATGGAINVISNKPVLHDFGGHASVTYGNYSSTRDTAAINLPIGNNMAVRFAGIHVQHSAYMKDGTGSQNSSGGRLSFLYEPSDDLTISLVADYYGQGGSLSAGTVTGVTSSFSTPPPFSASDRLGFFSPQVSAYISGQKDFLNGANFLPFQNVNFEHNRFWGVESHIDWRTSIGTVTVIPAYRESDLNYRSFATGVMLRELSHEKSSSIEVRLSSDKAQRLKYVVGAFYLNDPEYVPSFIVNQQANVALQSYSSKTRSDAVFGNLTYSLTPAFKLIGGARYTRTSRRFVGTVQANTIICTVQTAFGPSCPNAGVFPYTDSVAVPPVYFNPNGTILAYNRINDNQSLVNSHVTWRGGVQWNLTRMNMLYANVETGFKAGGFFFSSDTNTYKPETITAYTVGSKNRFFNNRLQANFELFYWKYRNQQISHLGTDSEHQTIFPTQNIGQATYKGIEVDLKARPFPSTVIGANVQYNDAIYNRYVYTTPNTNGGFDNGTGCVNAAPPGANYTIDCSGKQPPYAPLWSISGSIQQTVAMPGGSTLVGEARVHYQTRTLTALEFLPVEEQAAYTMWNFDLTYYPPSSKYFVGAYVDNAFDATVINFSFRTPFSNMMTASLRPPQSYGVRAGVHF